MRSSLRITPVVVALVVFTLCASGAFAADKTWNTGASDFWNTATWINGAPNPAGGDQAFFGDVGTGFVNTLDQDYLLEGLYYENTVGPHTTDLGGNTLTIRNGRPFYVGRNTGPATVTIQNGLLDLQNADFRIGEVEPTSPAVGVLTVTSDIASNQIPVFRVGRNENAAGTAYGELDLTQASGTLSIWNNFRMDVGAGRDTTGLMNLGGNVDVVIGDAANVFTHLAVGDTFGRNEIDSLTTSGTINGNGAGWESHHSELAIGQNIQNSGAAHGMLDLRGSTGSLTTYGWSTRIGVGRQAAGTMLVDSGMTVSIGNSEPQKADVNIGYTWGQNADGQTTSGNVQANDSTFNLHTSWLTVGGNEQNTGSAVGTLNMADVAGGTVQTYGWALRVGLGQDATGTVDFGNQTVSIGQNFNQRSSIQVADTQNRNLVGDVTTGTVRANNGTVFDAYVNDFYVGQHYNYDGEAHGTLDLSAASGGTINVYGEARVGVGGRTTGQVTLAPAMTINLGTVDDEAYVRVGDAESHNDNAGEHTTGVFDPNGAVVNAELTGMRVGWNNREQGSASGTMDLSTAAGGAFNTRSDQVMVGWGGRATGLLKFAPTMTARLGRDDSWTHLRVGDTESRNLGAESTEGQLLANGADVSTHLNNVSIGFNNRDQGQVTGVVDLSTASGGTFNTYGHTTFVGFGGRADGLLKFGPNMTVNIGQSDALKTWLRVGDTESKNLGAESTEGELLANGANVSGHLSHINIGYNNRDEGQVTGVVDLSTASGGSINTYGHNTLIGYGGDADGQFLLGATDDVFGRTDNRTFLVIGHTEGRAGTLSAGEMAKTGGTFEGHFSNIWVGRNWRGDNTNAADGLLDLSGTTMTAFDFENGEMIIGRGYDAVGEIIFPAGTVNARGRTFVGDPDAGAEVGGSGRLALLQTLFVVADNTEIDVEASGEIDTLISGLSSGLSVEQIANWGLEIRSLATAGGGIELTFDAPSFTPDASNPYWGLRWRGDHVAALEAWLLAGAYTGTGEIVATEISPLLDINDLTVGMYNDGVDDYSYIGFTTIVPEPATLALLALGGVAMVARRKRS